MNGKENDSFQIATLSTHTCCLLAYGKRRIEPRPNNNNDIFFKKKEDKYDL